MSQSSRRAGHRWSVNPQAAESEARATPPHLEASRATRTVTEAAAILGISRSTAYELAKVGELPALRLGRRIVIPTHALVALLASVEPEA